MLSSTTTAVQQTAVDCALPGTEYEGHAFEYYAIHSVDR